MTPIRHFFFSVNPDNTAVKHTFDGTLKFSSNVCMNFPFNRVFFFVMKKNWCVCVRESWPLSVKFSISSVFYVLFLSGFTVTFDVVKAASKPGKRPSKLKLYFTSSIWLTILEILQRYFPFFFADWDYRTTWTTTSSARFCFSTPSLRCYLLHGFSIIVVEILKNW